MLSHNYNERPTAKELLDSHLFDTPQEETMQSLLEQNQVFSYSLFDSIAFTTRISSSQTRSISHSLSTNQ